MHIRFILHDPVEFWAMCVWLSYVCKLKTAGGKKYKFSSASVEVLVVTMEMKACCRGVEITHGVNHCSHPLVTEHTHSLHRYKLSGLPRLSHGRPFLILSHIHLCGFCGPLNGEVHCIRAVVRCGCVWVSKEWHSQVFVILFSHMTFSENDWQDVNMHSLWLHHKNPHNIIRLAIKVL